MVQSVPNSTETWLEAAKYRYKQKCGVSASAASSEEGIVAKSAFSMFGDKQDQIWDALVKAEYINKKGVIQKNFEVKRENFKLKVSLSTDQKNQTFDILQQAYYPKQLQDKNPGRPHPAAADVRWWPWIDHNVQGEDIMFEGPDPVCPKPPAPEPCKPCQAPGPAEPVPLEGFDLSKPVHGRKKKHLPARVTQETKNKLSQAADQVKTLKLVEILRKLREPDLANKLQNATNEAKKIIETKAALSEKKARQALKNLNALIKEARQTIKKIREGGE